MKQIKQGVSLLLALVLFCSVLTIGVQAAECTCENVPRIWVPGIGGVLLDEEGNEVPIANTEGLQDAILPLIGSVLSAAVTRKWDQCADEFISFAWGMFGHLQVDEMGESVEAITSIPSASPRRNHKQSNDYRFTYDWRMDPMEIAAQLNDYIEEIKLHSGHSQVSLVSHSEGGVVTMAYFAQYGYDSVRDLILVMSAHNGLTMVGELFNKNLELDADVAMEYLRSFAATMDQQGAAALMAPGADLLQTSGLADLLVNLLGTLLKYVQDKVFDEALIPLFVQWPALWGFVPHEYYSSARDLLLSDPKYDDYRAMIDNMHSRAGAGYKADDLILGAVDAGVRVSIVASYGFAAMPLTPGATYDSDGLIDTVRESSGAVTAGVWKSFPAGYTQKIADGHDHISPDRHIDASACLLPEQTWFIRNQLHFTLDFDHFLIQLLNTPEQPTITTYEEYPQFLTFVSPGAFKPTEPAEPTSVPCLLRSIWNFLKAALPLLWDAIVGAIRGE